jgi:hypothetical protein
VITSRRYAVDGRWLVIATLFAVALLANLLIVYRTIAYWHGPAWGWSDDWNELVQAATSSNPYTADGFRWSPVAAWILGFLVPLGIGAWRLLHFAALLVLRDWRVIALVLVSFPFWVDMVSGNVLVFAFVAAWAAIRGSRAGGLIFLAMVMLMPRPLFVPVTAWLLWKHPALRIPMAALLLGSVALVASSGLGPEWIGRLASSGSELGHPQNIAPSRWIGAAWIPIGALLAVVLTWRGRLGLASLAASPYLFAYYLLFGFLELAPRLSARRAGGDHPVSAS